MGHSLYKNLRNKIVLFIPFITATSKTANSRQLICYRRRSRTKLTFRSWVRQLRFLGYLCEKLLKFKDMEKILKEYKSFKDTRTFTPFENISVITYLANLSEDEIITTEIEAASNILHYALKDLYTDAYDIVQNVFNQKRFIILQENSSGNSFKIYIRNVWLFHIMLINSLKHSDILNNLNDQVDFLKNVIDHILKNIVIVKPLSLHLLRTLLLIVTKRKDILSPNLSLVILKQMNRVAVSPITSFRQYAKGISKAVIFYLPEEYVFEVSLLPVKGAEMCDVVKRFSKTYIQEHKDDIIKKVLDMFLKNVESKEGGVLYECLLFYSFEEWKQEVWPSFFSQLKHIDYDGEFFQSLFKYWITSNISTYKNDFYTFLREEPIDTKLKAYILLESTKKGCNISNEFVKKDVLTMCRNFKTRDLGLRLATTYHKKSLWPQTYEIDIVMNYLYSNTNLTLEEEEMRSLRYFISQIFLHAHNELKKTDDCFSNCLLVLERIYEYCYACLKTSFYEVGAEIICILWTVATGTHKDLLLNYKLEKKDNYDREQNLLLKKLKHLDLWWFEKETFHLQILQCFQENKGSSTHLTKLLTKHLKLTHFCNTIALRKIIDENSTQTTLESEKLVRNYSEIVLQNQYCKTENLQLLHEIDNYISNLATIQKNLSSLNMIFKGVLYLEVVQVAAKYNQYDKKNLNNLIENALLVVENIITMDINSLGQRNYKTTKISEAFINKIMTCMMQRVDDLWDTIDKKRMMDHLILIIQRSNMKRPLSLSVEVLKLFGSKMQESDLDQNFKIRFLNNTLQSLRRTSFTSDLKIRRNPESRLVIHALCSSDPNPNKPLLKWVLTALLEVISNPDSSDSVLTSAFHTIEILLSDNNLQGPTLPFASDIIVQCVELFSKSSWMVRNADLQLTRAIIDRFYGVCLDISNRPKSIEDLFILFPNLSEYFYKILSSEDLDEKAVLVFQYFSISQTKENICTLESLDTTKERFLSLFVDILQKYSNHYGKMACQSFSSLCTTKKIPEQFCSIVRYLEHNSWFLNKNALTNFLFLIEQLYGKYKNSFYNNINPGAMKIMNFALNKLLKQLRKCESRIFNFVLFKVKPLVEVFSEFDQNSDTKNYVNRLWLHNYIPFLFINGKPEHIKKILSKVLLKKLSSSFQIKILTILLSRYDRNEFASDTVSDLLEILFQKSISVSDNDNYLLNCYFRTILVFYHDSIFKNSTSCFLEFKYTSNVYKLLIYSLYYSSQTITLTNNDNYEIFFKLLAIKYVNTINFDDELKNDIISTLPYSQKIVPKVLKVVIFKLLFYSSIFTSTYLETVECMSLINDECYPNILTALKTFFSVRNLSKHFVHKLLVVKFFNDVVMYMPGFFHKVQSDGYYSEESDILIPKLFLERWIYSEIRNI